MVGIIANPASGKDIRRLVASATTIDNREKVSIIQRVLAGLGVMGIDRVGIMPEAYRMGQRAVKSMPPVDHPLPQVEMLDMAVTERAEDSIDATRALVAMGAGCLIVLGGDGTTRVVSCACGEVPLLPISTGTNNVLPTFVEGTIAGLAAGAVAQRLVEIPTVAIRHKWIQVLVNGEPRDRALVDVAAVRGQFVGARAIWGLENLRLIMVTRAAPTSIGISAIAAAIARLTPSEPRGMVVNLAQPDETPWRTVRAPLGPGLVPRIGLASAEPLQVGQAHEIVVDEPWVLALDGERETLLHPGDHLSLLLRDDGPWIVDSQRVMAQVAAQGTLSGV